MRYLALRSPLENFTLAFRLHQVSGAAFARNQEDHTIEERGQTACFALFRGFDPHSGAAVVLVETQGWYTSPPETTENPGLFGPETLLQTREATLLKDGGSADFLLCLEEAEPEAVDRWAAWAKGCQGVEAVFHFAPAHSRDQERLMFDF